VAWDRDRIVCHSFHHQASDNPLRARGRLPAIHAIEFAAQAMAAELSTGAPAMVFVEESGAKLSMLVTGLTAKFSKKATRTVTFAFTDGARMKAAVEEAARTGKAVTFDAKSVGTQDDGTVVAEFEINWSFKRKKAAERKKA